MKRKKTHTQKACNTIKQVIAKTNSFKKWNSSKNDYHFSQCYEKWTGFASVLER